MTDNPGKYGPFRESGGDQFASPAHLGTPIPTLRAGWTPEYIEWADSFDAAYRRTQEITDVITSIAAANAIVLRISSWPDAHLATAQRFWTFHLGQVRAEFERIRESRPPQFPVPTSTESS